jgi:flavin-binding protein dodecin
MSDNKVFKLIELTGTSSTSIEEAVQSALSKASETIRQMRWFEVVEIRGAIDQAKVAQWQVTLKIGFAVED